MQMRAVRTMMRHSASRPPVSETTAMPRMRWPKLDPVSQVRMMISTAKIARVASA